MPKSKTHQKRKLKLRKKHEKVLALSRKRLAAFRALPEEEQQKLLERWAQALSRKRVEDDGDDGSSTAEQTDGED